MSWVHIGNLSDDDVILLTLRQVNIEIRNDINALFAENDPKDKCNSSELPNL